MRWYFPIISTLFICVFQLQPLLRKWNVFVWCLCCDSFTLLILGIIHLKIKSLYQMIKIKSGWLESVYKTTWLLHTNESEPDAGKRNRENEYSFSIKMIESFGIQNVDCYRTAISIPLQVKIEEKTHTKRSSERALRVCVCVIHSAFVYRSINIRLGKFSELMPEPINAQKKPIASDRLWESTHSSVT